MVERKLYKTKLCVLYQRGRCNRYSCNFAHGNAELRRFSSPFKENGICWRDIRGRDLREKLDRRRSPMRGYSPGKSAREESPSQSPRRKRERRSRNKQHLDDQSERSGSLRMSYGTDDQVKDEQRTSSGSKDILHEQLEQVQSEINILHNHRQKLEIYLDERTQEADRLTMNIQELELQINQEKDECKRVTSKIKKFIRAYNRYSQLQDDLKRSHAQLQKLGEQLGSEVSRRGANGEDINFNTSDGETARNHVASPENDMQKITSPNRKRPRVHLKEAPTQENPGSLMVNTRLEKFAQRNLLPAQSNSRRKIGDDMRSLDNEIKFGREINRSTDVPTHKVSESSIQLPLTGMAAHAIDEVEIAETVEKLDKIGTASGGAGADIQNSPRLPFLPPPPPPIPKNAYLQYIGADKNVDTDGLEEETMDVEIV